MGDHLLAVILRRAVMASALAAVVATGASCATSKPKGAATEAAPAPMPAEKDVPAPDATVTAGDDASVMAIDEFERRWSVLLAGAVHPRTGLVDYRKLSRERGELGTLVGAAAAKRAFDSPRQELAFRVNVYNLLVVAQIVEGRPRDTVRDVKGFFSRTRYDVLGEQLTIDSLRDLRIRPMGDARVHAALCNGSVGSAPLLHRAYAAATLDADLTHQAIRFVNDPTRVAAVNGVLMLSPIFDWFGPDFEVELYGSALGFVKLHASPGGAVEAALDGKPEPRVEFMAFNWALNSR